mmetsp:Transcript_38158/g.73189  ORF Transcript_38158/g.73189 Transcript_38158/m.73189 type:complete len:113 (+) Transcript_38158:253-591(+)|eukprot:CAMPEP_0114226656 /NCGR_PEP_ID=MMETSP0058-20121206/1353_1 /TAXON_ID=36894 /ORGANISM="Pyramimonas parkeae, CCMP726" /LENGTH=112 /DNA_ID=CAMNT_0001337405 /DNA_START=237 /DNA_END=575 /DNA_ORIENTATION=+
MVTGPLFAGLGVAAAALAARGSLQMYQAWRMMPPALKNFYNGGFESVMTRREAALILGLRESASPEKITQAHRKIMIANHPDTGGSPFIATKVNQAKEVLTNKTKSTGSPFG